MAAALALTAGLPAGLAILGLLVLAAAGFLLLLTGLLRTLALLRLVRLLVFLAHL